MHVTTTRVRYDETDQAGIANHASYLSWFEVGRTEMLRDCGHPYSRMESEEGVFLTVVEARLQYRRPARYDDLLQIETRVEDVKRVRMKIGTRILSDSGKILCEGHVWLASVTREGRPLPLPDHLRRVLDKPSPSTGKTGASVIV